MGNFEAVINTIDELTRTDPNQENGSPKEWLYSLRMSQVLHEINPNPSELLEIAARGHHICRWKIPRGAFPDDKNGYHKWRKKCRFAHAKLVSEIMADFGYTQEEQDQVAVMIRKEDLGRESDSQTIEDVACLVFLRFYAGGFVKNHNREKVHGSLVKIWSKMSPKAQQTAMTYTLSSSILSMIR